MSISEREIVPGNNGKSRIRISRQNAAEHFLIEQSRHVQVQDRKINGRLLGKQTERGVETRRLKYFHTWNARGQSQAQATTIQAVIVGDDDSIH